MAWFAKKEWKNRLAEFAGRRTLTDVATGASHVVDVARSEGTISQEGDAFSAANMNEFEQRILEGFTQAENANTELNKNINKVKTYVGSDGKLHFVDASGADSVLPFSSKPIKLGTARSYNLTSYANYKNFTNASFLCECLSSSSIKTKDNNESGTYTFHGGATYTPITKSYNASTGVLTISGGTIKASIYRNNVDQGMSQTSNLTVTTWLIP